MYSLGTIREFRTANFTVIIDAVEECDPDLSWDDDGSVAEKINSGEFLLFCARARVIHPELGEVAADYLGNCVYESLDAFRAPGGYFASMVREVCREARQRLVSMRAGLNGLTVRESKQ